MTKRSVDMAEYRLFNFIDFYNLTKLGCDSWINTCFWHHGWT